MSFGEHLLGALVFSATLAAALTAAGIAIRRGFAHLTGAPRAVGFAVLATLALSWAHLLPGMLGVLDRWTVLAAAVLLAGAATAMPHGEGRPAEEDAPSPPDGSVASWALAASAAAAVAIAAVAYLRSTGTVPTMGIDALSFHLPGVGEWIQTGSLWEVGHFVPNQAQGYYPGNGDLMLLAGSLPWEDDAFLRFVGVPFLALTGLAVYAMAVELGSSRPAAATAAALFLSIPVVMLPALQDVMPDAVMLSTFGAGGLFLLRAARTGRTSELTMAGVALGLSFGSKWYGVTSVAIAVGVWALASAAGGRGAAWVLRRLTLLAGLIAVAGGFWFLRNLVASGNPVFPVEVELLGLTVFAAPPDQVREAVGLALADYLGDGEAWSDHLLPALWRTLKAPAVLIGAGAAAALWFGLRRLPGADRRLLPLSAAAILLAVAYFLTPYSALGPEGNPVQADANTRYGLPALLAAAPAAAVAATLIAARSAPLGLATQVLAPAAIATGLAGGLAAPLGSVVAATALVAAGGAAAYALYRYTRRQRFPPRAAIAAGCVAAAVCVFGGHELQQRFNSAPYAGADPALDSLIAAAPSGERVAVAGAWTTAPPAPVFPAFGSRFGNEVSYAGPVVEDMLRRYRDCPAFFAHLREERYGLLLVGRPAPALGTREEGCALRAGIPVLARSDRFALFGLRAGSEQRAASPDAAGE